MIKSYKDMLRNCLNFRGRTSVRSFWLAILMHMIVTLLVALCSGLLVNLIGKAAGLRNVKDTALVVSLMLPALIQWPVISLYVRRMRDTGEKWWKMLAVIWLLPVVGLVIVGSMASKGEGITLRSWAMSLIQKHIDSGAFRILAESSDGLVGWLHEKYPVMLRYADVTKYDMSPLITCIDAEKANEVRMSPSYVEAAARESESIVYTAEEKAEIEEAMQNWLNRYTSQNRKARLMHRGGLAMLAAGIAIPAGSITLMMMTPDLVMVIYGVGLVLFFAGLVIGYIGKLKNPQRSGDELL